MEKGVLNRLTDDWEDLTEIIVYGFGRVAQRNIGKLKADFDIKYIIDNDPALGIHSYDGIPIQKYEDIKEELKQSYKENTGENEYKYKIIVPTSTLAYASISKELNALGMIEYRDYCRLEEFLPEWYWKYKNQVCVSQIFSTVTTRCTFNCKYCSVLTPYYKKHYEYSAKEILADFDLLFKKVDYLTSYYVIGGEPLCNRELANILETIYDKYKNRIGYMQIITNGSIVPDRELIRVIKKCNINVRVSDYTHAIPYQKKMKEVIACLKENNLDYAVSTYKTWVDLGFPRVRELSGNTAEEVRCHMLNCAKGCHNMNNKKLYFCGLLFASEKLGLYQLKEHDYIDLAKNSDNPKEDKERILRYFLGDVENDHISLCRICRGQGTDNKYVIPVAEQEYPNIG